jgi:hypothetical protein
MANLNDQLFGPLSKKYCIYFYYLSVIGFILLLLVLVSSIYIAVTMKKMGIFTFQMVLVALS